MEPEAGGGGRGRGRKGLSLRMDGFMDEWTKVETMQIAITYAYAFWYFIPTLNKKSAFPFIKQYENIEFPV